MKIIGLLGGMSWESSTDYYRIINQTIKAELGGLHSAKCVLYSVDFQEIEQYQFSNQWDKSTEILTDACLAIEKAGADYIVICTNTMHKVADKIQEKLAIPILHIAKVTADVLKQQEIKKVGLLGTKFTMEEDFYTNILEKESLDVVIPNEKSREKVSKIIYEELCLGIINEESKQFYLDTVKELHDAGAEGVILGCTEIGMLISQKDTSIPLFDTTEIHATQAALLSLQK
ncbi:aspartate/glutamate racemase family protein [Enterococcus rivorum]|uniref:Aspartate racemase n=1 Tax=Enterococcus rivorum TaxID=762845 RepID=A0A1E5L0P0_9ENTE|nr:aspartate/glutamate racemase family protein [Enterococcus rivorum]MBP2098635.1 aspartate racemase [Enterococcus rivorum]OEH83732.1 aspartate racemase [Enterococcus rivorum]